MTWISTKLTPVSKLQEVGFGKWWTLRFTGFAIGRFGIGLLRVVYLEKE